MGKPNLFVLTQAHGRLPKGKILNRAQLEKLGIAEDSESVREYGKRSVDSIVEEAGLEVE